MRELSREILGLAVAITAPKAVTSYLARLLEPFPEAIAGGGQSLELRIEKVKTGGYLLRTGSGPSMPGTVMEIINSLLTEVNRVAIGALSTPGFHAGVVGMGEEVVAFPATSGAGKSTLTAACLLEGYAYWSDEALVCDRDGRVVPYPRPVMLSAPSLQLLGLGEIQGYEQPFPPQALGAEVGSGGARLTNLVAIERRPGAAELVELPASEGVHLLLENSFNHFRQPAVTFALVTQLAANARSWALRYEAPREAAELLKRRLS